MQAIPNAVDQYMASLDGEAAVIAEQVRQAIHRATPGIDESVRYTMLGFSLDGQYLVYLGAWKKHIGLYPIPEFDGDLERMSLPTVPRRTPSAFPTPGRSRTTSSNASSGRWWIARAPEPALGPVP